MAKILKFPYLKYMEDFDRSKYTLENQNIFKILDELGYVSFDKAACKILFNLLSNRNDKDSIVISSNLAFDRWNEIFGDLMLTGAIVDRLAHRAHILDLSRDISYRLEDTLDWQKI